MNGIKKFLGIFVGISALVMLAGLILSAFNAQYDFMSADLMAEIFYYAFPILTALAALYFVSDKGVLLFVITAIVVAFTMLVYFNQIWFFDFISQIFGG